MHLSGNIKHVVPKKCRPPPSHPFARIISHHLVHCIHIPIRPVEMEYDLCFFLFTIIHRFVVVHRAKGDDSFRFFWTKLTMVKVLLNSNSELCTSLDLDGFMIAGMSGLHLQRVPTIVKFFLKVFQLKTRL